VLRQVGRTAGSFVARPDRHERRRLSGPHVRTCGSRRNAPQQLDQDRPGQRLVQLLPHLRSDPGLLRLLLGALGHRGDRVVGDGREGGSRIGDSSSRGCCRQIWPETRTFSSIFARRPTLAVSPRRRWRGRRRPSKRHGRAWRRSSRRPRGREGTALRGARHALHDHAQPRDRLPHGLGPHSKCGGVLRGLWPRVAVLKFAAPLHGCDAIRAAVPALLPVGVEPQTPHWIRQLAGKLPA